MTSVEEYVLREAKIREYSTALNNAIKFKLKTILELLHYSTEFDDITKLSAWIDGPRKTKCPNCGSCDSDTDIDDGCCHVQELPPLVNVPTDYPQWIDSYFIPLLERTTAIRKCLPRYSMNKCVNGMLDRGNFDLARKIIDLLDTKKRKKPISLPDAEEKPEQTENSEKSCVICKKNVKNTVNLPCGHTVSCVSCVREYVLTHQGKTCQICRKKITQVARIYA